MTKSSENLGNYNKGYNRKSKDSYWKRILEYRNSPGSFFTTNIDALSNITPESNTLNFFRANKQSSLGVIGNFLKKLNLN